MDASVASDASEIESGCEGHDGGEEADLPETIQVTLTLEAGEGELESGEQGGENEVELLDIVQARIQMASDADLSHELQKDILDLDPDLGRGPEHKTTTDAVICHPATKEENTKVIEVSSGISPTTNELPLCLAESQSTLPGAYALQGEGSVRDGSSHADDISHADDSAVDIPPGVQVDRLELAMPVANMVSSLDIPLAIQQQSSGSQLPSESWATTRRVLLMLVVISFLLVVIGTTIGMILSPASSSESPRHSSGGYKEGSSSSTSLEERLSRLLPSYTLREVQGDQKSPQSRAFQWMLADPHDTTSHPDWRLTQRYVLATLYFSTKGDRWTKNAEWLNYGDECNWYTKSTRQYGLPWDSKDVVHCDEEGRYRSLYLYQNNLQGEIPEELYLLTSLAGLNLAVNAMLEGTISTRIGQLTNLQGVGLSNSKLKGTIPSEVGQLTKCQVFVLSGNELSGTVPHELSQMTELQYLVLGENQLSSTLPDLMNLQKLKWLIMDENSFTGTLPLAYPPELEELHLSENLFTGTLPSELALATSLLRLGLRTNLFEDGIPSELGLLTDLDRLRLSGNLLDGPIPSQLGSLSALTLLALFRNGLSGPVPTEIGRLPQVRNVNLHMNSLSGPLPSQVGLLTRLTYLSVGSNVLTGTIPTEAGRLTSLRTLDLYGNTLSHSIPTQFGLLTRLTQLEMRANELTGELPFELGALDRLEVFTVSDNPLSGTIPTQLWSLPSLEQFWLNGTLLSGTIPDRACGLTAFDCGDLMCGCDCPCS